MPITASYSSATRKLTALGDAAANSILLSRDLAGTLFVNGGAVSIASGPATVGNTDLIELFGFDLNDILTLDETNGVLPAADLFGGTGNDTLTGGSNGDTLSGDAGVDTLLGKGGVDDLFGGADGDTLTGGDGNDVMNGEGGNDRMIWNPGDDNDVMEGGPDSDIAEINGGNGAETFLISQNGTRVTFERTTPAPFTLDIGTTESLLLNAGGGDDIISTVGNFVGLISLTLDGGAGNDTINGSNAADLIIAGDGNDIVDGNAGADTAFLGANDDQFKWDPGDGSDVVEGQGGTDELLFNGSNATENIEITPNGARVRFFRDVANIIMDLDDVEELTYRALGGADTILVADMTGTDLTSVAIDLGASAGGGDGFADRVTVNGTAGNDTITATAAAGTITVTGLFTQTALVNHEAIDRLVLGGAAGNDTISASGIGAGIIQIEMQGGLGTDTFIGSAGNDLVVGGDGNDLALMGDGDDTFTWNPGDDLDTVEGQNGIDTLDFNGNSAAENFSISPNGGRIILFRDVAAVTMDLNDVEQIAIDAGGGIDTVTINDLTGTDAQLITVSLAGTIGGSVADGAVDAIIANGSGGADTITLAGDLGAYAVTGLPYTLGVTQSEATDTLQILSGVGADVISAAQLLSGTVALTLNGGAGNDNITGSAGADQLLGGTENDLLTGGPGGDSVFGEAGNDVMAWANGDGSDLMEGGDGSDQVQVEGSSGGEAFVIAANGARVAFNRVDPAPFALDIGTTEQLVLFAKGGNDTISTAGNLAALISLTLDGGSGNDTILAGNGIDLLLGGDGDDFVDGQQGNDTAFLGAGNDVFQWDPGDGSDLIDGQADIDALIFNGNGANEIFNLTPSAGRTLVTRDVGLVSLDTNDLEQVVINAGAGADSINIPNLAGTDVNTVTVNLSSVVGGGTPDGVFDSVVLSGSDLDNLVTLIGAGSSVSVLGLPAAVSIAQADPGDSLSLNTGSGNDFISASSVGAGVLSLLINGGVGNDTILGSAGGDTLLGDVGNDVIDGNQGGDVAFLGDGDDSFIWDPGDGSDVIEGQTGIDTLLFNGSNANEIITISPNGGRSLLTRDVASIIMDMDDMETLTVNTFGGSDTVNIANMAGTDVTKVVVNLAAASGLADGLADTVTINASAIGDIIDIDLVAGVIVVTGLSATVEIRNFDALDRLVIQAGDGNDDIDASGVPLALTIFGGIGNDTIVGGIGRDIIMPGAGANFVFFSPGPDLIDPTGGTTATFI